MRMTLEIKYITIPRAARGLAFGRALVAFGQQPRVCHRSQDGDHVGKAEAVRKMESSVAAPVLHIGIQQPTWTSRCWRFSIGVVRCTGTSTSSTTAISTTFGDVVEGEEVDDHSELPVFGRGV